MATHNCNQLGKCELLSIKAGKQTSRLLWSHRYCTSCSKLWQHTIATNLESVNFSPARHSYNERTKKVRFTRDVCRSVLTFCISLLWQSCSWCSRYIDEQGYLYWASHMYNIRSDLIRDFYMHKHKVPLQLPSGACPNFFLRKLVQVLKRRSLFWQDWEWYYATFWIRVRREESCRGKELVDISHVVSFGCKLLWSSDVTSVVMEKVEEFMLHHMWFQRFQAIWT